LHKPLRKAHNEEAINVDTKRDQRNLVTDIWRNGQVVVATRQIISVMFILSVAMYASCHQAHAAEPLNLLKNPGFEEVGVWKTLTADANDVADPRSPSQVHSGNYSAYTKATTIGGDGYAMVSQDISISISSNLELSFWLYVRHHELPFYGYIKCFVTSSGGRYLDVGIWSDDSPKPKANEYHSRTRVEKYDAWFRIRAPLGKLWISEAKFPEDDTITIISFGIYNGLVYALPKNLLQLEAFFDDVFLGPSLGEEEPSSPWLTYAAACLIGAATIVSIITVRKRLQSIRHPRSTYETSIRGTLGLES